MVIYNRETECGGITEILPISYFRLQGPLSKISHWFWMVSSTQELWFEYNNKVPDCTYVDQWHCAGMWWFTCWTRRQSYCSCFWGKTSALGLRSPTSWMKTCVCEGQEIKRKERSCLWLLAVFSCLVIRRTYSYPKCLQIWCNLAWTYSVGRELITGLQ